MDDYIVTPIGGQSEHAYIPAPGADYATGWALPVNGEAPRQSFPPPPMNEGPPPSDWRAEAAAAHEAQAKAQAKADFSERIAGVRAKAADIQNPDKFRARLAAVGYKGFKPSQVAAALGKLTHLWSDWLIVGEPAMLKSPPKYGKTRTYLSIIKALHCSHEWPDGSINKHVGSKALILPYDKNTLEIQEELERLGIEDAVTIPADPDDPTGTTIYNLDDPRLVEMVDYLVDDDPTYKLLVVDTLTYASTLSLNKPDEMKRMLDPIMNVAARRGLALLVLIHQNAQGGALGRRITERARILWALDRLDENDPSRLRLSVEETNLPRRPSLLVTHAEAGVEFGVCQDDGSRPAPTEDAFAEWLVEWLRSRGREASWHDVMREAGPERVGALGDDGRPTGRKILDRAVKRINAGAPSLSKLGRVRIEATPRKVSGSNREVSHYSVRSLDEDAIVDFLEAQTQPGGYTPWDALAAAYAAWAEANNRPEIGPAEIRFGLTALRPAAASYAAKVTLTAPQTTEPSSPPPPPSPAPAVAKAIEELARIRAAKTAESLQEPAPAVLEVVVEPTVEEASEPAQEPVHEVQADTAPAQDPRPLAGLLERASKRHPGWIFGAELDSADPVWCWVQVQSPAGGSMALPAPAQTHKSRTSQQLDTVVQVLSDEAATTEIATRIDLINDDQRYHLALTRTRRAHKGWSFEVRPTDDGDKGYLEIIATAPAGAWDRKTLPSDLSDRLLNSKLRDLVRDLKDRDKS
ncbi:AAA family ATPase [Paludisphaera rhizosphaerae]|uniref:AAA family ATPase n=1 Tax=Paludisphaera rhizosphaerae TaxID=2711216 RepID=UPI0013EB3BBB|nr:AAA family ATPase [Paludisphaera rhizosphaerae]